MFYELRESVTIVGRDIWGRHSEITFRPNDESVDESNRLHWHWAPTLRHIPIPISPAIACHHMRRVQLTHKWRSLNCWEHLGALRYLFPCGITVVGDGWPPFFGSLRTYRERLMHHAVPLRIQPVMYMVDRSVGVMKGTFDTVQELCRFRDADLESPSFFITMQYPGFLNPETPRSLIASNCIDELFQARVLGHSMFNAHRSLAALATMFGWPHFAHFNWTGYEPDRHVSDEAVYDRAVQILGVMSLLGKDGLFIADVDWKYSGLKSTLEAVRLAEPKLVLHDRDAQLSALFSQQ